MLKAEKSLGGGYCESSWEMLFIPKGETVFPILTYPSENTAGPHI